MMHFPQFESAINHARSLLKVAPLVHPNHWQGVDISMKPEMATFETLHFSFNVQMPQLMSPLGLLREDIGPNLPWADDHFEERVCGQPINPGIQWAKWPWGRSAEKFLDYYGKFNHNYMERYWPRQAGHLKATETVADWEGMEFEPHRGIKYNYGDLRSVVEMLSRDPLTRQAYLPIFFPEDTGYDDEGNPKRCPCTLGYHFIVRNKGGGAKDYELDLVYYIRSCDFVRHFRDDIYMTARLLLWVIDACRANTDWVTSGQDEFWENVKPGNFVMHITSLHLFKADYVNVFGTPRSA
jgi:hypothetical protein